jgi:hypothetical protein
MPPPSGRNWETFIEEHVLRGPDEVDIKTLQPGDKLVVMTKNTRYEFDWAEGGGILLRTDRPDRPWGPVTITGCALRRSGILNEGVIFRGGKIQFSSGDNLAKHQTTVIVSMALFREGKRCSLRKPEMSGTDQHP